MLSEKSKYAVNGTTTSAWQNDVVEIARPCNESCPPFLSLSSPLMMRCEREGDVNRESEREREGERG
jgi:hypothetical protein